MNSVRQVLAISPHLDDAALSVGATLAEFTTQGAEVEVLTLFAGAPDGPLSEVARAFHAKCGLPTDATAVALRRDEDRAAMRELGAHARHREFLDAIYRRAPDGQWLCRHDQAMFDAGRPPVTTPHLTRPMTAEAWEQKRRAIARYTTQVRMLWPTDTDWAAQLLAHAHIRGHGHPAELLFHP